MQKSIQSFSCNTLPWCLKVGMKVVLDSVFCSLMFLRSHSNGSIRRSSKNDASDAVTLQSSLGKSLRHVKVFNREREKGHAYTEHSVHSYIRNIPLPTCSNSENFLCEAERRDSECNERQPEAVRELFIKSYPGFKVKPPAEDLIHNHFLQNCQLTVN